VLYRDVEIGGGGGGPCDAKPGPDVIVGGCAGTYPEYAGGAQLLTTVVPVTTVVLAGVD